MPARSDDQAERPGDRWLVRLILLFYVALLAEGILRKWLLPGASSALVFLRDPMMLVILAAYLRRGPSPAMRTGLAALALLIIAFVLCAACQALTTEVPALVLLVGIRNYFFFVALCFAIGDVFTPSDYGRWIKLNLVLAVPIAILVFLQYRAPPTAAINAVPGGGNDGVFMLVDDVVRPYGVFSFTLGHSAFAAWMVGVALAAFLARRALGLGWLMPTCGLVGIAIMGVLSGSRTYFVLAGSVVACFGILAMGFGPPRAKAAGLAVSLAVVAAGVLALLCLPDLSDRLLERQSVAVASEGSTIDRLVQVLTDFSGEFGRTPLFGDGLGSGTNIANFLANGRTDHVLAEYELTRLVQELGPLFGGLYILVRWSFLAWLVLPTVRAARRGNLHPACFLGFLAPIFLAHDITLQNTMIGIGWFAAGILLAAARVGPPLAAANQAGPIAIQPAWEGWA